MEEFIKILGAVAAIFAIYKVTVDVILARSKKHRDEYQFAKDYITDLESDSVHRYVLEKGFRALTGDLYPIEEIRFLLSSQHPTQTILLRSSTRSILKFDSSDSRYTWVGKYSCEHFRKIAGGFFISMYSIFAFVVLFPFLDLNSTNVVIELNPVTSISFAVISIYFVIKYIDFRDAEELMKLIKPQK